MSLPVGHPVPSPPIPVPSWATTPHPRAVVPRRPAPTLRVGDAERGAVCEQLSLHYGEGRLDAEELEERLGAAMAARTQADLLALVRDLPVPPPTTTVAARASSTGSAVVAVLVLLASLAVCGLMILGSLLVSPGWAVGAVIGGSVAAVGGIAIGHLWSLRR